jgi:hypothetical protein
MKVHGGGWVILVLGGSLGAACSKTGGEGAPVGAASLPVVVASAASAPAPSASAAVAPRPERRRGRGEAGTAGMLLGAARDLDLKDSQKAALVKAEDLVHGGEGDARSELKQYHAVLVAGVRAGAIDTAKLAPLEAGVEKAAQARKDKEAEALNALWGALDVAQRKAVVAAVRARQAEREARMAARNADAAKPGETDWGKRRLEHLTKSLGLDAAQRKSVEALIAKEKGEPAGPAPMDAAREEAKKRAAALLTAFEGEGFDAKTLERAAAPAHKPGDAMDRHVQFLVKLLPILKPEQREKLAASMDRPRRHGGGPPFAWHDQPRAGPLFEELHADDGDGKP